jgi:hypothetical protein
MGNRGMCENEFYSAFELILVSNMDVTATYKIVVCFIVDTRIDPSPAGYEMYF